MKRPTHTRLVVGSVIAILGIAGACHLNDVPLASDSENAVDAYDELADGGSDVDVTDANADVLDAEVLPDASCSQPGAQQCFFGNAIATCGTDGKWGNLWTCTTGACSGSACTGSTTTATSCADAGLTCGPTNESCCTSTEVAGGSYHRTYTNAGDGGTGEADPATVSGFRLDKYEVTVARFRPFVTAWGTGWRPPPQSGKHSHLNGGNGLNATGGGFEPGWSSSDDVNVVVSGTSLACDVAYGTWTASANDNLPINCVNWFEAYAFCIWDGGFLSSESEWEYAAAAGSEEREFPWGSTLPGTASQYAIYGCDYPDASGTCCQCVGNIAPVGTPALGAGRWGQLDLAGNLAEWNLDWNGNYVNPCADCVELTPNTYRVSRGGFFFYTQPSLLPTYRSYNTPTNRNGYVGVRCARTP